MELDGGAVTDTQLRVDEPGILAHAPRALSTRLSGPTHLPPETHLTKLLPLRYSGPLRPLRTLRPENPENLENLENLETPSTASCSWHSSGRLARLRSPRPRRVCAICSELAGRRTGDHVERNTREARKEISGVALAVTALIV